jgi:RNA polymerase sigma-70 factor (ECF subfamily)
MKAIVSSGPSCWGLGLEYGERALADWSDPIGPLARRVWWMGVLGVFPVLWRDLGHEDDAALLARAAAADQDAFRRLYERHSGAALALALRVLQSRGEAEEVVQEVFVELWRRAAAYDRTRGQVRSWILTITRNRAIDLMRARGVAQRSRLRQPDPPEATEPASDRLENEQDRRRIATALTALPAEQREVIELAYFQGLTQSEIAQRTGTPLGTVKTRVRAAMSKLVGLLGAPGEAASA